MSTPDPKQSRREKIPGHPGLYRNPNGTVTARFRDQTGKVRDRTYRTLTDAVRAKGAITAGDRRPDARVPFRAYALEWIANYAGRKQGGADEATRASYEDAIKRLAIPFFGTTRLERVDAPTLKRYVKHLEGLGLAPASVRRYFAPVRALLATAYDDGLLAHPVNVRVIVEDHRPPRPHAKHLTAEQTVALIAEIPAHHADLALLYATTGARLSEPFPTRYCDLGHDVAGHPTITFPRSKTAAGLKPIRLTPEMAQALTRRRAAAGAGPDDLIFPGQRGQEVGGRDWRRRVFKPAAERAGIPWATPHMLRHGVATLMAESGATATDIGRALRHADGGRLAMQTYIHPAAPDVTLIDDALRAARKSNN